MDLGAFKSTSYVKIQNFQGFAAQCPEGPVIKVPRHNYFDSFDTEAEAVELSSDSSTMLPNSDFTLMVWECRDTFI